MSKVGFYRIKCVPNTNGTYSKTIYINNVAKTKTASVVNYCTDQLLIKFIDKNGQYRFVVFDKQWGGTLKTESIGKTSDFVTSILTAKTNKRNVGFEVEKEISVSKDVENACLAIYEQLAQSPKIYLSTGQTTWIEIIVKPSTFTYKRNKANSGVVNYVFELPDQYTTTLL